MPVTLWAQHGYIISQPTSETWWMQAVIPKFKGHSMAFTGLDSIWFNNWAVQYYSARYDVRLVTPKARPDWLMVRGTGVKDEPGYELKKSYVLPDGTILSVYART
jgi:hypothetical protein